MHKQNNQIHVPELIVVKSTFEHEWLCLWVRIADCSLVYLSKWAVNDAIIPDLS